MKRLAAKVNRALEAGSLASRTTYSNRRSSSISQSSGKQDLKTLFHEVEKLVGGNASALSLRFLLSDELSAVAVSFGKLIRSRTSHPLSLLLRAYVLSDDHVSEKQQRDQQATRRLLNWFSPGTVVLLCGNAVLSSLTSASAQRSVDASSPQHAEYNGQLRTLAETVELVHIGSMLHRAITSVETIDGSQSEAQSAPNVRKGQGKADNEATVELGNKLSTLSGDYLLAKASVSLAKLRDTRVTHLIATSIGDAVLSQFDLFSTSSGRSDETENEADIENDLYTLPSSCSSGSSSNQLGQNSAEARLGGEWREWIRHVARLHASLLRNACRSTVLLCSDTYAHASSCSVDCQALQRAADEFASSFCFALALANAILRQRASEGTAGVTREEVDPYALMLCDRLPPNASTASLHEHLAAFCARARAAALRFADSPHRAGMLRLADSIRLSVIR